MGPQGALVGNRPDRPRDARSQKFSFLASPAETVVDNTGQIKHREEDASAHGGNLTDMEIDKRGTLEVPGTTAVRPHTIVMCLCGTKLSACPPPSRSRALSSAGVFGSAPGCCTPFGKGGGLGSHDEDAAAGSVVGGGEGGPTCPPMVPVSSSSSSLLVFLYHSGL